MTKRIIIVHKDLKNEVANVIFSTAKKDDELIKVIEEKKKQLEEEGYEIFHQVDNIIVTELGYFAAYYSNFTH